MSLTKEKKNLRQYQQITQRAAPTHLSTWRKDMGRNTELDMRKQRQAESETDKLKVTWPKFQIKKQTSIRERHKNKTNKNKGRTAATGGKVCGITPQKSAAETKLPK